MGSIWLVGCTALRYTVSQWWLNSFQHDHHPPHPARYAPSPPENPMTETRVLARAVYPPAASHSAGSRPAPPRPPKWRRVVRFAGLLSFFAGLTFCVFAMSAATKRWTSVHDTYDYVEVSKGKLSLQIIERGNLESQDSLEIRCPVPNLPSDGIAGTAILWMVPNGATVQEGDLIVQFDSTYHELRVDEQVLELEEARADQLKATARYENQITRNETSLANAELAIELATLALQSFEDEEGGTYQLALQDIELQIQLAQSTQLIRDTELDGVEQLYALGYKSSGDVAKARLEALGASRSLASALTKRRKSVHYDHRREKLFLEGALETARRNLVLVRRSSESLIAQTWAVKNAADEAMRKEREQSELYERLLENCQVYAPRDGMVVYGREIREGLAVYQRRLLMTMPNLRRMKVKAMVHESAVSRIKLGARAYVELDSRPGTRYRASVTSLSVMPHQEFLNTGAKQYESIVTIEEDVVDARPGMTSVVTINIAEKDDVVRVPVESVVQLDGIDWCYVDTPGGVERRPVKLGSTNEEYVEIEDGLTAGERIMREPQLLAEESTSLSRMISPETPAPSEML